VSRLARPLRGAVAAAALAVAACSPAEPAAGDPGVSVTLLQYRRDQSARVVQVKTENSGKGTRVVDAVELASGGFGHVGPVAKGSRIRPGRRVVLPVPLGEVRCTAGGPSSSGEPAVVRLWLDGAADPVEPDVAGTEVLQRIHDRECAQREATAAVAVSFGTTWTRTGEAGTLAVTGVLILDPAPGRSAAVASVEGTTLFSVDASGLPVRFGPDAGGAPVGVPVRFVPQRCDPHAVGESKRGFAFGVRIAVEGRPETVVDVSPDDDGREVLQTALLERCGLSR
jgi:hypothetical protein